MLILTLIIISVKNAILDIIKNWTPIEIEKEASFEGSLCLCWKLVFNNYLDIDQSQYAVQLLDVLKKNNPIQWESDWRNEAFLGTTICFTLKDKSAPFEPGAYLLSRCMLSL